MGPKLMRHFLHELAEAHAAEVAGDVSLAWQKLERAHILSQAFALPHLSVHLRMFAFAWRRRDLRELLGQLPRMLVAAPGSALGSAPLGNTGGANVGILTPMPIPADLQAMLEADAQR